MKNDEHYIVQQLKSGDERAYKYIYDQHYSLLCHIAYGYLKDTYLAESIVGDTIFHLWEIRESLEISSSLRSYLVRAVRNRSINHLDLKYERTEVTFSSTSLPEENHALSDEYPLGKLLEKELESEIKQAIGRLPEECRTIFIKSRFENKKYDEIASEMNITAHTVKYHIRNALSRLQADLSKYLISLLLLLYS